MHSIKSLFEWQRGVSGTQRGNTCLDGMFITTAALQYLSLQDMKQNCDHEHMSEGLRQARDPVMTLHQSSGHTHSSIMFTPMCMILIRAQHVCCHRSKRRRESGWSLASSATSMVRGRRACSAQGACSCWTSPAMCRWIMRIARSSCGPWLKGMLQNLL